MPMNRSKRCSSSSWVKILPRDRSISFGIWRFDHDLIDEEEGAEEEVPAKQSSEAATEEDPIEKSEAA